MKKAVVQVNITIDNHKSHNLKSSNNIAPISEKHFKQYAHDFDAEYYNLTERFFTECDNPTVESLRVPLDPYWEKYGLVLFVDNDVLINKPEEDIFSRSRTDKLNCAKRLTGNAEDTRGIGEMIRRGLVDETIAPYEFNSGVVVYGWEVFDYFREHCDPNRADKLWGQNDQHEMAYLCWKHGDMQHYLDWRWNDYRHFASDSYFHHYKGSRKGLVK